MTYMICQANSLERNNKQFPIRLSMMSGSKVIFFLVNYIDHTINEEQLFSTFLSVLLKEKTSQLNKSLSDGIYYK